MMRIGIITVHKSEVNFGACLQSYALWRFIQDLGNDCEIIDLLRPCHHNYKKSRSFNEHNEPLKKRIKAYIRKLFQGHRHPAVMDEKRRKFSEFNKLPKYSRTYCSVEELYRNAPDYDIYLTGSDQVWNPNMPFVNEPYFLTFAPHGKKKISYAASFGTDHIPQDKKAQYRKWLLSYDEISIREESGARIVEGLTGILPRVVLDPVFLLSADKWRNCMKEVPNIKIDHFVFLYMLKYDEQVTSHAVGIAKAKNLPLYMVLSENRIVDHPQATQLPAIGPQEWLWLIDNADTVLTTSFHGTAFCVILGKPFAVFLKEQAPTNTRITGLLSRFGLKHHLFYQEKIFLADTNLSVNALNKDTHYSSLLRESRDFLLNSIGKS